MWLHDTKAREGRTAPSISGGRAHVKRERDLWQLAYAPLLACVLSLPAGAQFSAQPAILSLSPTDSVTTATVTVRNESTAEQQYRFVPYDFDQDAEGGHAFMPPGRNARSCAARLSVFPSGTTLLPGERQEIRVRLASAPTACWSVLFIQRVQRDAERGIRPGEQIAIKIYGFPPDARRAAEVTRVSARADSTTSNGAAGAVVELDIRNTGEAPLRPQGTVEVRTLGGQLVAAVGVDAFSVLPGHTRHMTVVAHAPLAHGEYVAVPVLDVGADYLVGGQGRLQVP